MIFYAFVKKIFFLTLLYSTLFIGNIEASIVKNNKSTFSVNGVRVDGASFENEQSTKQIALEQARQTAFNDLIKYLKYNDLSFDEININSAILSYSIVDEFYNENFYSLIANFEFDKDILNSIIKKTIQNKKGTNEIADYVVVLIEQEDIVKEYQKLNNFLKKEKISFYPIKIEADRISVLLQKVDEDKIYNDLKGLKLNGKIYSN